MNIQDIQAFLAIEKHGSISAAAKALFTTQPTVSSHLARLEKELEMELFQRGRGRGSVMLTPAGKSFLPLAQKWMALEQETLRFKAATSADTLRLGASIDGYEHIMAYAVDRLNELAPSLKLQLYVVERSVAHTALLDQTVDAYFSLGIISESPFIQKVPLFTEERYLLCRTDSNYPEGSVHAHQLDPNYEIATDKSETFIRLQEWHNQHIRPTEAPYFTANNQMILYHFLKEPNCWAICPASITSKLIRNNPHKIAYRTITPTPPPRYCSLLFLRSFHRMDIIKTLYDTLRSYAAEIPYLHPESYPDLKDFFQK